MNYAVDCAVCMGPCERESINGRSQHRRVSNKLREPARAKWSALEWRDDPSWGARWFLDDKPIHCGAGLELQEREDIYDDGDEFTLPVQRGVGVRFELAWTNAHTDGEMFRGGKVPMMHASIGSYEFKRPIESWMRFRWPQERRS